MNMHFQKLRLGLLLDSYEVPAWFYQSLEQIIRLDCAEFSLIVIKESHEENHASRPDSKRRQHQAFAYRLLNRVDENVFRRGPDASAPKNLQEMLNRTPSITVDPVSDGEIEVIKPEDVQRISDYNLDILIKVGFNQLGGDILHAARYGIWYYVHSDFRRYRGGPPGFWEVAESCPDTGATLFIAGGRLEKEWVIYQSHFFTYPFSPFRNRNICLWMSAAFLPRQISLLYRIGEAKFYQTTAKLNTGFNYYDGKQYQTPTNLEALHTSGKLLSRNLFELYKRVFCLPSWFLMVSFTANKTLSFAEFQKIKPPKDRFWADPHVVYRDGKYYVFVEEFIYQKHKGQIAVIEMDEQGRFNNPVSVLETDYHLSYPFVFESDQHLYMVPESSQNRTIDLYECVDFPTRWEHKKTLMENVLAVDTTLFFYAGKWWLFTGITENEGGYPEVELFLFYADDLLTSEWKSHPLNPVITDVACARPAGSIFIQDGRIYRPSQDCTKTYGYGFNFNEILCLNEMEYEEKKVASYKPNWDERLLATHTFTRGKGITLIDGLVRPGKWL